MSVTMRRSAWLVLVACVAHAAAAQATQPPDVFSGYVSVLSNYVGRGLSQSVGRPALQAELDYNAADGWYAGASASSINWVDQVYPGDSVHVELDGWLGYRKSFGHDWTLEGGLLRLQYPGHYAPQTPPAEKPDTTEAFGFVGWRNFGAKLNYAITDSVGTPDSQGSWYLDLSASLPLTEIWSAGVHLGRRQSRGRNPVTGERNARSSYTDYKISLARSFAHRTSVIFAYTWTSADPSLFTLNGYNVAGHHFWVSLRSDF